MAMRKKPSTPTALRAVHSAEFVRAYRRIYTEYTNRLDAQESLFSILSGIRDRVTRACRPYVGKELPVSLAGESAAIVSISQSWKRRDATRESVAAEIDAFLASIWDGDSAEADADGIEPVVAPDGAE